MALLGFAATVVAALATAFVVATVVTVKGMAFRAVTKAAARSSVI